MKIAIASDHAGFNQKPAMVEYLKSLGHEVVDFGPQNDDRVDYPDFADKVARYVAAGNADRGVLICGTGIGMALTADKVPGIRAAVIQSPYFAHLFREHNDGNVVCMSGRFTPFDVNKAIVDEFLTTEFGGGRHAGRVQKIMREDDPSFKGVDA
jgi:ribose 5-phosphate isomerase B